MIKIGDIVFVQTKGICKVDNIAKDAFNGCDKSKEYFVLKPVDGSNNMMIYLPTDTKVKMRSLTGKAKIEGALKNIASAGLVEISAEEKRFDVYNDIVKRGDLEECLKLLKTLLVRKSKIQKRQFNIQEQKYINTILSALTEEVSFVLAKDKDEIREMLTECVESTI